MNIGMLWFDNDPKVELPAKVERAASYYRTKYGNKPTLCFVHPSMLPAGGEQFSNTKTKDEAQLVAAGVEVRPHQSVMPNQFWIGAGALNA